MDNKCYSHISQSNSTEKRSEMLLTIFQNKKQNTCVRKVSVKNLLTFWGLRFVQYIVAILLMMISYVSYYLKILVVTKVTARARALLMWGDKIIKLPIDTFFMLFYKIKYFVWLFKLFFSWKCFDDVSSKRHLEFFKV